MDSVMKATGTGETRVERIRVAGIPIDNVPEQDLPSVVESIASSKDIGQVVFLRLWDLIRARRSREFRACLEAAALVIPVSIGIVRGARFLKKPVPPRYMPFEFVVRALGALEPRNRSVYVIGGDQKTVTTVEHNVKRTFPGVRLVGRYSGLYPRSVEADILTGIKKAAPNLVFAGRGLRGKNLWIHRHRASFHGGMFLWSSEVFDQFADKARRPSRRSFQNGTDFWPSFFRRPWRVLRVPVYLWYCLVLVVHRIRGL